MRNRMIKASFWASQNMKNVSRDARLLFIGLWNFADDFGVLENSDRRILGDLFPYDDNVKEKDVKSWKDELLGEKVIEEIEYEGHQYLFIPKWIKHQRVSHPARGYLPSGVSPESFRRISGGPPPQIEVEVEREVEGTHDRVLPKPDKKEKVLDYVFLLSEEKEKLKLRLGARYDYWIERLNNYIGQIGEAKAKKKYESHYHVILNWSAKEESISPPTQQKKVKTDEEMDKEFNDLPNA